MYIGALFARNPRIVTPLYPMFYGGGQERNFRPGTENTGMIAGLGQAAQLVLDNLDQYHDNMKMVSDKSYQNSRFSHYNSREQDKR